MRKFEISLADSDRQVYEALELRVAQHPSESERYLIARVVARVLEHAEGLDFSKAGVGGDDEPALVQRDLRGDLVAWIEIGSPSPGSPAQGDEARPRASSSTRGRLPTTLPPRSSNAPSFAPTASSCSPSTPPSSTPPPPRSTASTAGTSPSAAARSTSRSARRSTSPPSAASRSAEPRGLEGQSALEPRGLERRSPGVAACGAE